MQEIFHYTVPVTVLYIPMFCRDPIQICLLVGLWSSGMTAAALPHTKDHTLSNNEI